jgi:hypothetical protein
MKNDPNTTPDADHADELGVDLEKTTAVADETSPPPVGRAQPDLESLKLRQDFHAMVGVKKVITTVLVRKPNRHAFIRVHEEWTFSTAIFTDKENGDIYFVHPGLWEELAGEVTPAALNATIDRHGNFFLWPIPLPGEDGRWNEWHRSAAEIAAMAKERWLRVVSNRQLGAYEARVATGDLPEPTWPEETFDDLLRTALRDKFIDSANHPVLRRLRGEI